MIYFLFLPLFIASIAVLVAIAATHVAAILRDRRAREFTITAYGGPHLLILKGCRITNSMGECGRTLHDATIAPGEHSVIIKVRLDK